MSPSKPAKTRYPSWLKTYVSKMQGELRLAHWTIDFGKTYCSDIAMAEIQILPAQHSAILTLSNEWRKWTPSVMRATIAHELMHCHINPINELAEEHLEELSPKTFNERKKGMDYVNERVTDALAEMVSVHLTLPRMPARQQSKTLSHAVSYSRIRKSGKQVGKKGKKQQGSGKKRVSKAAKKTKRAR